MVTRATIALTEGAEGTPGLNLDGHDSQGESQGEPGCPHVDFVGSNGELGVDSQLARLGGVIELFGFGDINSVLQQTINEGALTILVELTGVQSMQEDAAIRVRVARGGGPLDLGTDGQAEPGQSFDVLPGSEVAEASGSIQDGVLRFGPLASFSFPLRFAMTRGDVRLTQAEGRFQVDEAGRVSGTLGGIIPTEDIQALVEQAIRDGGGTGDASLLPILERGLRGVADANRDPVSSRCLGITAGIEIDAVPAFILSAGD